MAFAEAEYAREQASIARQEKARLKQEERERKKKELQKKREKKSVDIQPVGSTWRRDVFELF